MIEPGGLIRGIPHVFDMRDEARDDDEVLRAVAEYLVGNVDVATLGVTNFRGSLNDLHAAARYGGIPAQETASYRLNWLL
jgi:hypothetical protein